MKYTDLLEQETFIDNSNGWGAVPHNNEVDYFGLRVKMKPSIFLSLAAKMDTETSASDIENHLKKSGKIASPFLDIKTPIEWSDNDLSKPATVIGHEGRNRMLAIKRIYGDNPIEVHLFFRGGINRSRHLTTDIVNSVNSNLYTEKTHDLLSGPFFTYK